MMTDVQIPAIKPAMPTQEKMVEWLMSGLAGTTAIGVISFLWKKYVKFFRESTVEKFIRASALFAAATLACSGNLQGFLTYMAAWLVMLHHAHSQGRELPKQEPLQQQPTSPASPPK